MLKVSGITDVLNEEILGDPSVVVCVLFTFMRSLREWVLIAAAKAAFTG